MEIDKPAGNENLPLSKHPRKLILYAELLAQGVYSCAEAARRAGYKQSVANGKSYRWVGKSREESEYPILWDYYEKLRRENLREFEVEAKTIARELALIAFSDVTRFIDLPRKEYEIKCILANETEAAVMKVQGWDDEQAEYRKDLAQYHTDTQRQDSQRPGTRKRKLFEPKEPKPPTMRQYKLHDDFSKLNDEQRIELMFWKHYRPGSIRLKNIEDIPKALLPVIAEVAETRDGIKIKLHDKLSALDKLARWKKMYEAEVENPEGTGSIIKEINVNVKGSRSTMRISSGDEDTAAA